MAFMSPEYLRHYKHAVDTAARLGLKMCLYDEFWFPSGSAGGLLKEQYPEALSKRLDKVETSVTGPATVDTGCAGRASSWPPWRCRRRRRSAWT